MEAIKRGTSTIASPQAAARSIADTPAEREVVPLLDGESFRWIEHDYPSKIARWVYHPEVEIHLIRRSRGSYIIGDQVGAFGPGHVSIVGSGVPHDWMSDLVGTEVFRNRDAAIQFTPEWLHKAVAAIPELSEVETFIESAKRGIVYSGETERRAGTLIELVGSTRGAARLSQLFELFHVLISAPASETMYVMREFYSSDVGREGKLAVEAGLAYILENLSGQIRMSEAARLAMMSEPSFSKYFKKASGMTFSDLVRRLRIASACRLLDQTDAKVAQISMDVGYPNLANFNRQFLVEMSVTPRTYRKLAPAERQLRLSSLAIRAEAG
jgi:AraC-like DNA-binding protein